MPAFKQSFWHEDEDRKLLALIDIYGAHDWVIVSSRLSTRSPKQCRERYHQVIKPDLNRSPISDAEGRYILQMVAQVGTRWAMISRSLKNNRSDNSVKNWWHSYRHKCRRLGKPTPHVHDSDVRIHSPNLVASTPSDEHVARRSVQDQTDTGRTRAGAHSMDAVTPHVIYQHSDESRRLSPLWSNQPWWAIDAVGQPMPFFDAIPRSYQYAVPQSALFMHSYAPQGYITHARDESLRPTGLYHSGFPHTNVHPAAHFETSHNIPAVSRTGLIEPQETPIPSTRPHQATDELKHLCNRPALPEQDKTDGNKMRLARVLCNPDEQPMI